MESLFRRYAVALIAVLALAGSGAASAQAPQAAGRFVSVTGDVAVVGADGTRRAAERGGDIREGDTIVTGDSSLAQARMSDGGLISIRAESEFKLEQFSYKGREDRSAGFVVNIIKGGFRTITGLIAQVNRSGYRVTTPAATIGVRGTHFEVVHVLPQGAAPQVQPGTYNRVFEGVTTIQNPAGNLLQVIREQTAFAGLQGGNPILVAPPPAIFGRPTPVPRAAAPQTEDRGQKDLAKREDRGSKMERGLKTRERPLVRENLQVAPALTPTETVPTTTLRTPLDTTTTLRTPLDTTTTIKLEPISPTLSPTTTLTSPTTTLTSPTTTLTSPTTTLTSPTNILTSPTRLDPILSPTPTTPKIDTTTTTIKLDTTTTTTPKLDTNLTNIRR